MSKTDVQVSIGADTSPLAKAFARAKDIVVGSGKDMQKNMPKVLGNVKALSGALGGAAAAAGLVPGLGVAAIGVAGLLAGVNWVRQHYEDAAKAAADMLETTARIGALLRDREKIGRTESENLAADIKALKEKRSIIAGIAAATGEGSGGESDAKTLALNEEITKAENKQIEIESAAAAKKAKDADEFAKKRVKDTAQINAKLADEVSILEDDARIRGMSDKEHLKAINKEIELRKSYKPAAGQENSTASLENRREILKLEDKAASFTEAAESKAAAQREADFNKEQAQEDELARLQSDRAKARMTDQQKFIALIKAGRAAQKAVNADPNDMGSKIKLEGLRSEYETMTKGKTGKAETPKAESTMKNGVLVSAEDSARSAKAMETAKAYDAEARSKAIGAEPKAGAGKDGKSEEALTTMSESMVSVDEQLKDLLNKFN